MTPEELQQKIQTMMSRIAQLAHQDALIFDEDDREFILGLNIMREMQEPIPLSYFERVERIYRQTSQNAFTM